MFPGAVFPARARRVTATVSHGRRFLVSPCTFVRREMVHRPPNARCVCARSAARQLWCAILSASWGPSLISPLHLFSSPHLCGGCLGTAPPYGVAGAFCIQLDSSHAANSCRAVGVACRVRPSRRVSRMCSCVPLPQSRSSFSASTVIWPVSSDAVQLYVLRPVPACTLPCAATRSTARIALVAAVGQGARSTQSAATE